MEDEVVGHWESMTDETEGMEGESRGSGESVACRILESRGLRDEAEETEGEVVEHGESMADETDGMEGERRGC